MYKKAEIFQRHQVNSEWKLYKEYKGKSTITLKVAMLLLLTFGSRSGGKI